MTGASSLKCHNLTEDVQLSAHGRHPTAYPFYFLFLFSFSFIYVFVFHYHFSVLCFKDKCA
jgi:hypothetical protein